MDLSRRPVMSATVSNMRHDSMEKQQEQLDAFEDWLSWVEDEIKAIDEPIGIDQIATTELLKHVRRLEQQFESKNQYLEDLSNQITVYDESDPESMKLRSESYEDLNLQLIDVNDRWTEACNYVNQRHIDLNKALVIICHIGEDEQHKTELSLNRIEGRLYDMEQAVSDLQADSDTNFVADLRERYLKIDQEIKTRFRQFTDLSAKIHKEMNNVSKSLEPMVAEIESKFEAWQSRWSVIIDRQHMLKHALDALIKSCYASDDADRDHHIRIPLPEPITCSEQDLRRSPMMGNSSNDDDRGHNSSISSGEPPRAIAYQSKKSPISIGSPNMTKKFEASNSDLYNHSNSTTQNKSASITITSLDDNTDRHDTSSNNDIDRNGDEPRVAAPSPRPESCRVEEWKHSLESFSLWLKQVETSLGVDPEMVEDRVVPTWSRLNLQDRLSLLDEIEQQVITTCGDEFDRLISQGQQIIESFSADTCGNDMLSLENILTDIEERWSSVRECLTRRRHEITRADRWHKLIVTLRELCDWIDKKDAELMPESQIAGDLITLAQQKDYLLHLKKEIAAKDSIESSRNEAILFFEIFHCMEKRARRLESDICESSTDQDLIGLKTDIELENQRLSEHLKGLMEHIQERIKRIDEVQDQMQKMQHCMQQMANGLQEAEIFKSEWQPIMTMDLRSTSEQLDRIKSFRDRLGELETVHTKLNEIFDEISGSGVPLSDANILRLDELNAIWSQLIVDVDERQKSIEEAFESLDATEQEFLNVTVDQPWERRVAASKVPYFVDHLNGSVSWDHPRFTELMVGLNNYNDIIFSAYRTAIKLRVIQGCLGLSCIMLETLKATFKSQDIGQRAESMIGVTDMLECLKMMFAHAQRSNPNLDVALCIDLCLSWILSLFDTTRVGTIRTRAFQVGLVLLCCATCEEKYAYVFQLATDDDGLTDDNKLCSLFSDCLQIPRLLAETDAFVGADSIDANVQACLREAKLSGKRVNLKEFLSWLSQEPQFIIWLPVLHRVLVAQGIKHKLRCKICRNQPMAGLRYKCLMCFNYNICQNCFLYGRHLVHHKKCDHSMQEYCSSTTSGENVRDLTKILRNKFKTRNNDKINNTEQAFITYDEMSNSLKRQ